MNRCTTVFSDMDGTLLNSEHKITPLTLHTIRSLKEKEIRFVVVSARSPSGIYSVLDEYGLVCPIICYSGALILDSRKQVLFHRGIAKPKVKQLIEFIEKSQFDLSYCLFSLDQWVVKNKNDQRIKTEEGIVKVQAEQGDIDSIVDAQINKIFCICNPLETINIENSIKSRFPELSVVKSSEMMLEIMDNGINKATAIKTVCNLWNIDLSTTIAFGDNFNDVEMLQTAGKGYLMANAPDQLKEQFSNITVDNDHDGIYEALRQLHLI